MNVYDVTCDLDAFRAVFPRSNVDFDWFMYPPLGKRPMGKPFGTAWPGLTFREHDPAAEDYNPNVKRGDFVGIGSLNIGLTRKAKDVVGKLFEPWGELLPIDIEHGDRVWWFHCTTIVDAFDEARSDLIWMDYSFFGERIGDVEVFQMPKPRAPLFCTEPFKRKIEALGLTGLSFRLVWSDEPESIEILKRRRAERARPPTPSVH